MMGCGAMGCDCAVMATFNRLCVAQLLIGGGILAADACHQDICIRPSVTGPGDLRSLSRKVKCVI